MPLQIESFSQHVVSGDLFQHERISDLYEGDRSYLPFNPNKTLEKQDTLQMLSKFNITRVITAWLIVEKEKNCSKITSGNVDNLYGNIVI